MRLAVYDGLGRELKVLASGYQAAGRYEVSFEDTDLPGRIYFYRLEAGAYQAVQAMTLAKQARSWQENNSNVVGSPLFRVQILKSARSASSPPPQRAKGG